MSQLNIFLPPASLALRSAQTASSYQNAEGFPHIVIDDFLTPEQAEELWRAIPPIDNDTWINYLHVNEKKYGLNKRDALPAPVLALIDRLNSPEFLAYVSDITGIPNLKADHKLEGGGLHQIPKGGFLNLHADFTTHPHNRHWRRRLNILIYMNKDWKDEYGGHLELWTRDMKRQFRKIAPVFNRCVIFTTDKDTFHGHPDPLTCPDGMTRKSLALYYFTEEENPLTVATNYYARPGESRLKHLLVRLDVYALRMYNWLKGKLGINDDTVSRLLRFFSKR